MNDEDSEVRGPTSAMKEVDQDSLRMNLCKDLFNLRKRETWEFISRTHNLNIIIWENRTI